jgi:hypothetical protein
VVHFEVIGDMSRFSLQTRIRESTHERHVTVWNIIWDHDAFPHLQGSDGDPMGNCNHHSWHLLPLAGTGSQWMRHFDQAVESPEQGRKLVSYRILVVERSGIRSLPLLSLRGRRPSDAPLEETAPIRILRVRSE